MKEQKLDINMVKLPFQALNSYPLPKREQKNFT